VVPTPHCRLDAWRLPYEKIDHSSHAFDPRDRDRHYAVVVNRTSPSSHTRGHASVLFYAEAILAHFEALGVPVINPVRAYRFEKSKALQLELFERLGIRYPPAIVVNNREQILKALDRVGFPLVVKPNVGGSGAGIARFDAIDEFRFDPYPAFVDYIVERARKGNAR
jgi:glutathione synthase/RimK-type ligase-like ATP-grasp enzyme